MFGGAVLVLFYGLIVTIGAVSAAVFVLGFRSQS